MRGRCALIVLGVGVLLTACGAFGASGGETPAGGDAGPPGQNDGGTTGDGASPPISFDGGGSRCDGLVLYAPFDTPSFTPVFPKNLQTKPAPPGDVTPVAGRHGNAVSCRNSELGLTFANAVPLEEGSLRLLFKLGSSSPCDSSIVPIVKAHAFDPIAKEDIRNGPQIDCENGQFVVTYRWARKDGEGSAPIELSGAVFGVDQWHDIVMTWSVPKQFLRFYFRGALVEEVGQLTSALPLTDIELSDDDEAAPFQVSFDELALWSRALSDKEVAELTKADGPLACP